MRRFAALPLALYAMLLAGCGDTPTPTPIIPTPAAPTQAPASPTNAAATATVAATLPPATNTLPPSPAATDTPPAPPAATDTVAPSPPPAATATPEAGLPSATATEEEVDPGLPWKAYGNSNPVAPYGLIYPRAWRVLGENGANPAFARLPQQVRFAAPGPAQWGADVYSGPTPDKTTPQMLLREFIAGLPDAGDVRVLPPLTDTMTSFAAQGSFTMPTAQGVLTGTVDIYQKAGASYLIYSYYDNAGGADNFAAVEGFYPLAPLAAVTPLAPGKTRSVSLPGIGTLPCPKGWPAGTSDAPSQTMQCNNQVTGGMGNASIQVHVSDSADLAAARAAQEASLQGLPYAAIPLASDLVAYVVNSGLVGDRIEYLRVLPRDGGAPGGLVFVSDSGPPADDLLAAMLGFRPAK